MNCRKVILWIALGFLASCATRRADENAAQTWAEMDTLSTTMDMAFLPLRDSGSVAAVEKMMDKIALECETLAGAELPHKMNEEAIKTKLQRLKKDARALADEITSGTEDDVIGTNFYAIHDLYLEIQDAWKR